MPEGPTILIAAEEIRSFTRKRVTYAEGSALIDMQRVQGKTVKEIRTWGKLLLFCFDGFFLRIHFLLFGSYRVNERRAGKPKLTLYFAKGELNFYACSVKLMEGTPDDVFNWKGDVLNKLWSGKEAKAKLKEKPAALVCDLLLDQDIFSGVGNIIKNEVLFRIHVHPASKLGKIPPRKINQLVKEAVDYTFDFLEWKRNFELKKHFQIIGKKICPRCGSKVKKEIMGKTKRRTFYCTGCQEKY